MQLDQLTSLLPMIDQKYQDFALTHHVPGFAYGVVLNGKLIHAKGFGVIDTVSKTLATADSLFRIASMTKSFTAMAILKLRDLKQLRLDDLISQYIPEVKHHITIRDLMIHAGGFPSDDPWADRKLHETEQDLLKFLQRGISFSNQPGTAYEYSNLGYTLLGLVIQKVAQKPYEQFINETICKPIGMDQIAWDYTDVPHDQLAKGYRWNNPGWEEEPLLKHGIFGAMGGLITSIKSFSQYIALHQSDSPLVREMQQPLRFRDLTTTNDRILTSSYGYGLVWMKDPRGHVFIGHSGGLPGFGSNWFMMPDYGLALVLFGNVTYAPATATNLDVFYTILEKVDAPPRPRDVSPILKQRQKELISLLPSWDDHHTIFAQNFFLDMPLSKRKSETERLFSQIGKIVETPELIAENNLRGYFKLKGEKGELMVKFALTPETPPLIQSLTIKKMTNDSLESAEEL